MNCIYRPVWPWPGTQHAYLSGAARHSKRFTMNYLLMMSAAGTLALAASAGTARPSHPSPPTNVPPAISPASTVRAQSLSTPKPNVTRPPQGQPQTGQPNVSCGSPSAPNTPGNAAGAPGSAFNSDGKAGTVYAGQQAQNSKNPVSVSQYDVACLHQQSH
jgi:hypothetical protein